MPDEPDVLLDHIGEEHAAAIARAVSAWARLEYEVDELIWYMAGLEPEQGACLTAQFPSVIARLDALIALARVAGIASEYIQQLNSIRADIHKPREKRNRLVHDPWFYGYDSKKHYQLHRSAKTKLVHSYRLVSEDEVRAIEKEFVAMIERFREIRTAIIMNPRPSAP